MSGTSITVQPVNDDRYEASGKPERREAAFPVHKAEREQTWSEIGEKAYNGASNVLKSIVTSPLKFLGSGLGCSRAGARQKWDPP